MTMRNILLIVFVCFALFGCGEKKLTEEMLIGDWDCTMTEQTFKWEDGRFQNVYEPETEVIKINFFIENNILMTKEKEKSEAVPFDIKEIYDNPVVEKVTEKGLKFKFIRKVQYISNDKFTLLYVTETQENYSEKEISISQFKKEVTFERIKN